MSGTGVLYLGDVVLIRNSYNDARPGVVVKLDPTLVWVRTKDTSKFAGNILPRPYRLVTKWRAELDPGLVEAIATKDFRYKGMSWDQIDDAVDFAALHGWVQP